MRNTPNGPLASIVIPTYNHAHFFGSALQSVIGQTYGHWDAIVVDNHSDDDTVNVVKGFAD
jgi:glycosyltransferase involved in cell wall biosynthesis